MIRKSNFIVGTPEAAEAHMQRIDVLEAVRERFQGKPTPMIDASIAWHMDQLRTARGDRLD